MRLTPWGTVPAKGRGWNVGSPGAVGLYRNLQIPADPNCHPWLCQLLASALYCGCNHHINAAHIKRRSKMSSTLLAVFTESKQSIMAKFMHVQDDKCFVLYHKGPEVGEHLRH